MAELTLESLGLTREEILDRVVERIAESVLANTMSDEDGEEVSRPSAFDRVLKQKVQARIDKAIDEIAAKHVLPNIAQYVETLCLQETNKWGEKVGKPLTFVEYLVSRAEAYLREEVNYEGKPKGADSYSWKASSTRVAHLVHEHLSYAIQTAMQQALKDANSHIVGGIREAVTIKLEEVARALKVEVKTR